MDPRIQLIFIMLACFQVKHFVCDFPLQSEWMIRLKTESGFKFIWPLSAHCLIHAFFCLLILLYFQPHLWWLAAFDFLAHFAMDRIKSSPHFLGRYNDRGKPAFWSALGFDQMVHHLTSYYIIWTVVHS